MMNQDRQVCSEKNWSLWNAVVQKYHSRQDSLFDDLFGNNKTLLGSAMVRDHKQSPNAPSVPVTPTSEVTALSPKAAQRELIDLLNRATASLPLTYEPSKDLRQLLTQIWQKDDFDITRAETEAALSSDRPWGLGQLSSHRGLLLPEESLQNLCDRIIRANLNEETLAATVLLVVLPSVSQASSQLSHPTMACLCRLTERSPELLTRACLAPALAHTTSPFCPDIVARLVSKVALGIAPHAHLLMRSVTQRSEVCEQYLQVLEATCAVLPPSPQQLLIHSIATALQRVCSGLPTTSPRVGRALLLVVSSLLPHLKNVAPTTEILQQTADAHASPLQRAVQAKLKRIRS
ncbi:uncharacterized protein LOC108680790 [Hyalella azteca]|uniref:Uncharacterized protein LOC108680790 n=1 Tax=Hyalella azteca TaxID=294128 RepID=A0A8B7PIL7_HYAAZ|nr:uncharacterized protein LOC108680790 [Hyalella azteca]